MTLSFRRRNTIREHKKDILDLVGHEGPWQTRIFLMVMICTVPLALHNLNMSFYAPNLDHWCARPDGINISVEKWKASSVPLSDRHCSRFKHINFSRDSNNATLDEIVRCDYWEYDDALYGSTILSKWDLVCDKDWLISLSKSVFTSGMLVSGLILGYISDKLGRKKVLLLSNLVSLVFSFVCAFSSSFVMFVICRFFISSGVGTMYTASFVLLMEVLGPRLRSCYGIILNFGFSTGYVLLPLLAWLLQDWFYLQLVITIPSVFLLSIWWLLPESPRWLLSKGKTEEARQVLLKAAEVNSVHSSVVDNGISEVIPIKKKDDIPEGNMLDLFRVPNLWPITLNILFLWFVNSFVYYGLSYNTNELPGDPFVNFAACGAIEFPAYIFSVLVIRSMGRRLSLSSTMVVGGLACLIMYPLPQDPWWITFMVSMVGKFCITGSFAIVYVVTSEIFPTLVRNVGISLAGTFALMGSTLAPFARELGNATHPLVPQIVFGILALIGGVLVLLLPETKDTKIPDTFEEASKLMD